MIKVKKGKVKCSFDKIGDAVNEIELLLTYINDHSLDLGAGALAPVLKKYADIYQDRIDKALESRKRRNEELKARELKRQELEMSLEKNIEEQGE